MKITKAKVVMFIAGGIVSAVLSTVESQVAPRKSVKIQPNRLVFVGAAAVVLEISRVLIGKQIAAKYNTDALKLIG